MLFRQLFDKQSGTYTYLMASARGREELMIDPVKEHTDSYTGLIEQLDLKLVRAIEIHTHAADTRVYAAHDYKGWTASSIVEEKDHNPSLTGKSQAGCVDIMTNLELPSPKMMDVAVPANRAYGQLR